MNDVIVTRSLSKHYRQVVALDGVNLSVPAGSIFGILGPNGAGKTTLLELLLNLKEPTSGEATVLGTDSRQLEGRLFEKIAFASEDQQYQDWMTIRYLLDYLKPFYPSWDDALAASLVEQFGLPPDRKLKHLSRGMKMKTRLTCSLAYRPNLLILDEPFSGLDPLTREELIEVLVECAEETTIVLTSHDLPEIESFVSHIAYFAEGQLHFAEELPSLRERFRQVSVKLAEAVETGRLPETWLCAEIGAGHIRFVDSAFDETRTPEAVRKHFDAVSEIDVSPMALRDIFIALARAGSRR